MICASAIATHDDKRPASSVHGPRQDAERGIPAGHILRFQHIVASRYELASRIQWLESDKDFGERPCGEHGQCHEQAAKG